MIFANKNGVAPVLVAFGRGGRPVRNEQSHERAKIKQDRATRTPRPVCQERRNGETNERTNGRLSPSSVPLLSVFARSIYSPLAPFSSFPPYPPSPSFTLVTFPTAPASRGEDVIHACDATRIVLPHQRIGVELCRIQSRPRIHLSAITCPLEEEEEEEEANSGLASDRVVRIGIADRGSREHGSTMHRALLQPGGLLITVFAFFTPRMETGELAAVFGLTRRLTKSGAVDG